MPLEISDYEVMWVSVALLRIGVDLTLGNYYGIVMKVILSFRFWGYCKMFVSFFMKQCVLYVILYILSTNSRLVYLIYNCRYLLCLKFYVHQNKSLLIFCGHTCNSYKDVMTVQISIIIFYI